jgi:hypothetical protein
VKIQAIRNYTEDTHLGAILVERPLAASETISISKPAPFAPGKAARHYGVIPYSRGQAKALNRGGRPQAKITALGAIILLISAAANLGSAVYHKIHQARRLNEGQDWRPAQLEERISRNSRHLGNLAQSNQGLLTNLSLPMKLSNDYFNNGIINIGGRKRNHAENNLGR